MNDVEKTNIERQNSGKRMRRRKRMMSVYALVVVLLVATFGITMCFTFLFNIDEIVISGESDTYTYMEIVEASGISVGDNLFRIDTEKSEQKILDDLLHVETAEVHRDFPSTLRIRVTRCVPAFNIRYDKGVLLVSRKGKILADNNFYTKGVPIIYGFEPGEKTPGKVINSENENKNSVFAQLVKRYEREDVNDGISAIEMSNESEIVVTYENGNIFRMGNYTDVDYKLELAQNVMNDESVKGKQGYLTMIGSNQCSFRTTDDPASIPGMIFPKEETATDADGNILITTEPPTDAPVDDYSWQGGNDWSSSEWSEADDSGDGWNFQDNGSDGYDSQPWADEDGDGINDYDDFGADPYSEWGNDDNIGYGDNEIYYNQ